jgi:predicted 3-demethylubiquinone-9 3-methyltransferase (glyoxalase superfamily)
MAQRIVPNLWFDSEALEAAEFYVAVFGGDSRVLTITHYTEAGPRPAGEVMTVEFALDGERFIAINGGPQFRFSEAVSFQIDCETQAQVDYYWEALTDGGEESQCGWLKDRWGLSWQITPRRLLELIADKNPDRARRAMEAMLKMRRIDIAEVERAADAVVAEVD